MPYQVIIPAAGQGKRMGAGKNKLLLTLEATPILIHTLKVFEADPECSGIILAIHPDDEQEFKSLLNEYGIHKVSSLVTGGQERQDSVYNGLMAVSSRDGIVLVHDAARPFIKIETIHKLVDVASKDGGAIVAVPVKDTIKKAANNQVSETVERSSLWSVQTPQAFRVSVLLEAHNKAAREQFIGTDESSLVERIPHPVSIIEGDYDNIKLTTPEDLYFAEAILRKRNESGV
ncbi:MULTISPECIES: 2-C-methyl-D-erythritol 4-phosphate cytidylyltransferase [unclassified Mesobacillus]|uniref:2-C-methyl-D-erythritol 4-phosphate cytidylyltransferase n=1 Tax=unclassified Mesobacillus TaxID=2675270 RepID=UPI00203CB6A6|nr:MULTISPECIES: 2-C-methyl-D-erythritol 4-phosphate cytidylyltransferase [unclassified Mesobacillus]MCM3125723.1 2-C-methyl-D-erythritol 4-phosphate cytidylyltransferase [Mesobacillus sp. MER 33]MCM3235744.1 2-C-methyl-D-erythritol 4-phosphate cytidylyltransferase [Mesobacillus sp. MER 48]